MFLMSLRLLEERYFLDSDTQISIVLFPQGELDYEISNNDTLVFIPIYPFPFYKQRTCPFCLYLSCFCSHLTIVEYLREIKDFCMCS